MKQALNREEVVYNVSGTHCASCEFIIERKLLELPEISAVTVSRHKVVIIYQGKKPGIESLNRLFSKEGYFFSTEIGESNQNSEPVNWLVVILSVVAAFLLYLLIQKSGLAALIRVDSHSSLPTFFAFGLLAGFSSCAALVGGLVLGLSKNWAKQHSGKSLLIKSEPHLLFNLGRLLSYAVFGALLGGLGRFLRLSPTISAILLIAISILMLFVALQMLGISALARLQISAPKSLTRLATLGNVGKGCGAPFLLGFLTFILPCGFTLTAQSLALISGSAYQGASIMFFFALGTLIPLLFIGIGSTVLYENRSLSASFTRIAGILLLIFAIFNFNAGLNISGVTFSPKKTASSPAPQAESQSGLQIIKMDATQQGYSPKYFKVKANIPVRWEISDKGASGCTSAVISKDLFSGQIELSPGKTSTKEFTPTKTGKYRFSCWMGMVSGTIEVTN